MDGLIIGAVLAIIGCLGFYLAGKYLEEYKRENEASQQRAVVAQQDLIIDRIIKATDSLGKSGEASISTRLGALYALEKIAKDNVCHHIKIMEIICAYIRNNSPLTDKKNTESKEHVIKRARHDIQAALNIIGRQWSEDNKHLKPKTMGGIGTIDLHKSDLRGADLCEADLSKAYLYGVNLSNANLLRANLSGAQMNNTNLANADFMSANLSNAWLREANLNGANLDGANLNGALLWDTEMGKAVTAGIFACEGDFLDCKNLTQEQIDWFFCGIDVKIPNGLKRPKDWPKKKLSYDDFMKAREEWLNKKWESRKTQ